MFGDSEWLENRTEQQYARYTAWRRQIRGSRLVVIELGAGRVLSGLAKRIDKTLAAVSIGAPAEIEALVKRL